MAVDDPDGGACLQVRRHLHGEGPPLFQLLLYTPQPSQALAPPLARPHNRPTASQAPASHRPAPPPARWLRLRRRRCRWAPATRTVWALTSPSACWGGRARRSACAPPSAPASGRCGRWVGWRRERRGIWHACVLVVPPVATGAASLLLSRQSTRHTLPVKPLRPAVRIAAPRSKTQTCSTP